MYIIEVGSNLLTSFVRRLRKASRASFVVSYNEADETESLFPNDEP